MRIGLLHQYSLSGSGSCVYVATVAQHMAARGHEVHLITRERRPEEYAYLDAAYNYRPGGEERLFARREPARLISHSLLGNLQPVAYRRVQLTEGRLFTSLTNAEIRDYANFHSQWVRAIVERAQLELLHANHAVMMPYVAYTVWRDLGVPYIVTLHGSAIEYILKRDARFYPYAWLGLHNAAAVIVLNSELRQRALSLFPGIEPRLVEIPVGVDAGQFQPQPPAARPEQVARLIYSLNSRARFGKTRALQEQTRALLDSSDPPGRIVKSVQAIGEQYDRTAPDANLDEKLAGVDWSTGEVLIYFGKLDLDKGVHCLLAALPLVVARHPGAQLIIVGDGGDREMLALLASALDAGQIARFMSIADAAWFHDPEKMELTLPYLQHFLARQNMDAYRRQAAGLRRHLFFTGRLGHSHLTQLLPCADISIVPSIVAEAFPLVILESLACGVAPMGTYFSGLAPVLDRIAPALAPLSAHLRIRHQPEHMIQSLADNLQALLAARADRQAWAAAAAAGRRLVEAEFGWERICASIEALYNQAVR